MKQETKNKAAKYDDLINRQRQYQRGYNARQRERGLRQMMIWVTDDQVPLIRAARELPPELLRRALIAAAREAN